TNDGMTNVLSGEGRLGGGFVFGGGFETEDVSDVDQADRPTDAVDDGELAEFACGQKCDGVADPRASEDGGGTGGHDLRDGSIEAGFAAAFEDPREVAIGEQARKPAVGIGEHDGASAATGTRAGNDYLADSLAIAGGAAFVERTHDVVDATELAAERAAR